jgi:hypothetical protein
MREVENDYTQSGGEEYTLKADVTHQLFLCLYFSLKYIKTVAKPLTHR